MRRIAALAQQLVNSRITVVGLQEVTNWQVTGCPVIDFANILVAQLAARGQRWVIASRKAGS